MTQQTTGDLIFIQLCELKFSGVLEFRVCRVDADNKINMNNDA